MYDHEQYGYHSAFKHWHGGHRAKRGDMKSIILRLLKEQPMHGYEIISKLEDKSHGMWRPSAGSIYPNLQLLEEQDLVTSKEENGKKIYALTTKGEESAKVAEAAHKNHHAPWEENEKYGESYREIKHTIFDIMGILKQLATQDSDKVVEKIKTILDETKEKLANLVDSKKDE
jgi:DNA-binding PadR family transcriptional regulator